MSVVVGRSKRAPVVGALALALLLAGCGIFGDKADPRPCPRISILNDASTITLYRAGDGRDLTDIAFKARVSRITSKCSYRGTRLRSDAKIEIIAERGPGARSRELAFRFFVTIIDFRGNILTKKVFGSEIEFVQGRRRAGVFEEIEQTIELRENESGADYEIIVGFQLNQDQLERNRKQRR